MDIKSAIHLCIEQYPGRIPVGYWERDGKIIINTKPVGDMQNLTAPAQFVVTSEGKVYGANPIMFGLSPDTMKKI